MSIDAVLLTGATGFVGRALAADLRDHGYRVTAAVRRGDAFLPDGIRRVVTGDLAEDVNWAAALEGVDAVVHLAARVHVMADTAADPLSEFRRLNVDATLHLAGQAARAGVKRFIFISSIGVNGAESNNGAFSEAAEARPHSPYAVSKYEAEEGLRLLCANAGMEFVFIRPPLIYGPDAPGNFGKMIKYVAKRVPLPLGSINNRRSMVFLGNLVDFIRLCVADPRAANQVFLIADALAVSTPAMIRALSMAVGKKPRLYRFPLIALELLAKLSGKQNMYQQLCGSLEVDISKARIVLGWVPPISVYDGLRLSAEAYFEKSV